MRNMDRNSLDIISCLLDYIKEKIFSSYLLYIFKVLEDNNFLTTLIEIKKNRYNEDNIGEHLDESIIDLLKNKLLDSIKMDDNKLYEPKFLFNYKIPGLFNAYENLSYYIKKNITVEYFNSEQNLRYFGNDNHLMKFHEIEYYLLENVYEYINDKVNDEIFMYDIIKQIPTDLILKDYITYYLNQFDSKNEINNKLILLLLNLRFNEKNDFVKYNNEEPIKIILAKIMWIESNIYYIFNILKIFELALNIFNNDGNKLYNIIESIINNENERIKYIINPIKTPEHTREVNECYYIILASICYSITSDKIILTESASNKEEDKVEIILYYEILKQINMILQNINEDFFLFLNEMYIIDELIKVIEFQFLKKIDIEKINRIRKYLRKSAEIIQNDHPEIIDELIINLDDIYRELLIPKEEIIKEKGNKYYEKYYDTFRYIFYIEIKKINNDNYRYKILEYIIKEKEIIKKSSNIFQILFRRQINVDKFFKRAIKNILEANNEIINLIEYNIGNNQQENYFALTETLLYFFEKKSLNYFRNIFNSSMNEKYTTLIENEPMDIFKDCINFIQDLFVEKKKKYDKGNKYVTKLFCLGYIRIFCQVFIKMFDSEEPKYKEPEKIIEFLNKDKAMNKMIRLYIYKILFNKYQIDTFLNINIILKYKLKKYVDFKTFLNLPGNEQINYRFETLDTENYEEIYKILNNKKKDKFKNSIQKDEIGEKINIDNFYIASYYLILVHLKREEFINSEIYLNFYENICKNLYDKNNKYFALIQLLFNPKKYEEIKCKYNINSSNIEPILYSFRYVLNEFLSDEDEDYDNDKDYIYSSLYKRENNNYLSSYYYPGSDIKEEPYYDLYSKIRNHFIEKPKEGCYVCLCKKGFYHSVFSGFPGFKESQFCPNCRKNIGTIRKEISIKNEIKIEYEFVNRDGYYRIFKDENEINSLDQKQRENLNKIKYMTLKEFEEKYINKLYESDKGLPSNIDKNFYLRDNKIIRNLSQVSFRLLNFILYSHLFFARIFTNLERFDSYKPLDNNKVMSWGEILNESFILLKKELSKNGIHSIDIFMNFIFKELFIKLHEKECINEYKDFIEFEKDLDNLILDKIRKLNFETKKYSNKNSTDINNSFNLLKEIYDNDKYKSKEYPEYEYFYYSNYLDEDFILENILNYNDLKKYPVLNKYLNYKKNDNDKYPLEKLYLFNKVLNIINEKYSHKITRKYAENVFLKDTELYKNFKILIDNFIKFYNDLKLNDKGKEMKLTTEENHLSDFVLDPDNKYGKTYIDIYKIFIKKQNNEINDILDIKIKEGIFNYNCKNRINVQQIKKDTLNQSIKFSFIDIIYDSSYRKVIDTENYKDYNSFNIDYFSIEEKMTKLLVENKKLMCEDFIVEFKYNNEIFDNSMNNLITSFRDFYTITNISKDDKEFLFNKVKDNKNLEFYEIFINNILILIEHLNKQIKDKKDSNNIKPESIIYEVLKTIEYSISPEFLDIFKDKNSLTISKISEILNYFIKLIFKDINDELEKYQEQNQSKENLDKVQLEKLDNYFKKDDIKIKKYDLENALRLFITLVLFREKDKEKKVKNNSKNLIDYLKSQDLWEDKLYKDEKEKFEQNLNELKSVKIQINQTLWLYNYLVENKEIEEYKEMENSLKEKAKDNEHSSESENENDNSESDNMSEDLNDSDNKSSDNRAD